MIVSMEFRVYVGTYAKYNDGSIEGHWLDLSEYDNLDQFDLACRNLHKDEADPELMFQDWEGIPARLIDESWISPEVWDWMQLSESDREITAAYMALTDYTFNELGGVWGAKCQALDNYVGQYDSEAEAAEEIAGESMPDDFPAWIVIDWEDTWRANLRHDFTAGRIDGEPALWVFSNN